MIIMHYEVLTAAREVLASVEDNHKMDRQRSCHYMDKKGAPECFVGRILAYMNIEMPKVNKAITLVVQMQDFGKYFSLPSLVFLQTLQHFQDKGLLDRDWETLK